MGIVPAKFSKKVPSLLVLCLHLVLLIASLNEGVAVTWINLCYITEVVTLQCVIIVTQTHAAKILKIASLTSTYWETFSKGEPSWLPKIAKMKIQKII